MSGAFKGRPLEIWLVSIKVGKGPRDLNWINEYPPDNGGIVNIPLSPTSCLRAPRGNCNGTPKGPYFLSYPLHEKIFSKSKVWDRFSFFVLELMISKPCKGFLIPLAQVFLILGMGFGLVQVAHVSYNSNYKITQVLSQPLSSHSNSK